MTFTGSSAHLHVPAARHHRRLRGAAASTPTSLTLIGVLINVARGLGARRCDQFVLAGVIMIVANIFDFIDGKVAHITGTQSRVRRLLGLDARPLLGSRAASSA